MYRVIGTSVIVTFMSFLFCTLAFAGGSDSDAITPTAYFEVRGGSSVYKSKMVDSNDTSTSVGYGFGFYSGAERTVGMGIMTDTSTVPFELNNSSIKIAWQDTYIRYRFGPVYFGAIIGVGDIVATRDDDSDTTVDETLDLDISASGYGGNFGIQMPLKKGSYVYLDVASVTLSKVREVNNTEVTFGARQDVDIGANIPLTKKSLDFLFGAKYRTYSISVAGTTYKELQSTTYIGLQTGTQF